MVSFWVKPPPPRYGCGPLSAGIARRSQSLEVNHKLVKSSQACLSKSWEMKNK